MMNNYENKRLNFGVPYLEPKWNIPTIELFVGDERFGYLQPFRKYCFQISATSDGEYDKGSSLVVGLEKFVNLDYEGFDEPSNLSQEGTELYMLSCIASQAVMKACSREGLIPPKMGISLCDNANWVSFIKLTHSYLKGA